MTRVRVYECVCLKLHSCNVVEGVFLSPLISAKDAPGERNRLPFGIGSCVSASADDLRPPQWGPSPFFPLSLILNPHLVILSLLKLLAVEVVVTSRSFRGRATISSMRVAANMAVKFPCDYHLDLFLVIIEIIEIQLSRKYTFATLRLENTTNAFSLPINSKPARLVFPNFTESTVGPSRNQKRSPSGVENAGWFVYCVQPHITPSFLNSIYSIVLSRNFDRHRDIFFHVSEHSETKLIEKHRRGAFISRRKSFVSQQTLEIEVESWNKSTNTNINQFNERLERTWKSDWIIRWKIRFRTHIFADFFRARVLIWQMSRPKPHRPAHRYIIYYLCFKSRKKHSIIDFNSSRERTLVAVLLLLLA